MQRKGICKKKTNKKNEVQPMNTILQPAITRVTHCNTWTGEVYQRSGIPLRHCLEASSRTGSAEQGTHSENAEKTANADLYPMYIQRAPMGFCYEGTQSVPVPVFNSYLSCDLVFPLSSHNHPAAACAFRAGRSRRPQSKPPASADVKPQQLSLHTNCTSASPGLVEIS